MTIYKLEGPENGHKPDVSIDPFSRVIGDTHITCTKVSNYRYR